MKIHIIHGTEDRDQVLVEEVSVYCGPGEEGEVEEVDEDREGLAERLRRHTQTREREE